MRLENSKIVDFVCFSASTCDFFPVELLSRLLPNLKNLKASLKGILGNPAQFDPEFGFYSSLVSLTMSLVYSKNTLISIIRGCKSLKYVEVRELYKASSSFNDNDMNEMFCLGADNLEILRFPFPVSLIDISFLRFSLLSLFLKIIYFA